MPREIVIILPVHNRRNITVSFVNNLKAQTFKNFKLLLIDDGSRDQTAEAVKEILPETVILKGDGNLWWAGALQKGFDYLLENEFPPETAVLIINDDTVIPENFLQTGITHLVNARRDLICSSYSSDGKVETSGVHINWRKFTFKRAENADEIMTVPTRGLFLTFDQFRKIGGFYPHLLPHYFSDYEFTIRARRKGFHLKCPPDLFLQTMPNETGVREIKEKTPINFLKRFFSKRYSENPIYTSFFVLLAAPFLYKPICLGRILAVSCWMIGKNCLLTAFKHGEH